METTTQTVTASKSMRFDVLKRDNYTCQYCGRAAPEVMLEVDHHNPISNGGKATMSNLVTACYDCNRGKSDKVLVKQQPVMKLSYDSHEGRILHDIIGKIGEVSFLPKTIASVTRLIDVAGWGCADSLVWNLFDKCYGSTIQPSLTVEIENIIRVLGDRKWRKGNINLPPCNILCNIDGALVSLEYSGAENTHSDIFEEDKYDTAEILSWMPSPEYFFECDGAE